MSNHAAINVVGVLAVVALGTFVVALIGGVTWILALGFMRRSLQQIELVQQSGFWRLQYLLYATIALFMLFWILKWAFG